MQTKQPLHPNDLGRLARRISAWTTNSLLTFMLLVIALGFGREIQHWWHDEGASPPSAPAVPPDRSGDATSSHVLEFGDQAWSIRRQEFSGQRADVPAALQAACRAAIVECRPRGEAADAAEQDLLKRLAGEQPVAEEHGQWRLYQWGEGHPLLIGTRAFEMATLDGNNAVVPRAGTSADSDRSNRSVGSVGSIRGATASTARTSLDRTAYRVVIWGMAVPSAADAWTLYMFQSGGAAGGEMQGSVQIPLPPGGHRLVSIRATGSEAITAFSADDGDAARTFYDRWFVDRGWTVAASWRQIASGWTARFEMRSQSAALAVDVRLGIDLQGRWTGLVMESQMESRKP